MQEDSKEQKRIQKAQKKAEKLAKLEAKKEVQPAVFKKQKKPLSGGYDPTDVEGYWSSYWIKNESFTPKNTSDGLEKYAIVMPPPNITGSLHIGHAMMAAIEDCLVRYMRLNNHDVLFLPGLDHAGIATQSVVMRSMPEKTLHRNEFMNEAFLWSEKYSCKIYEQLNRLGASLDYTRKVFTLDKRISKSVNAAFCQLFNKGLIYRDTKIVNWCGKLKTSLSDLEVNYKTVEGGSYIEVDSGKYKFGVLYYFKYYLTKEENIEISQIHNLPYVVIATSRPETILGDSAICVNPSDPRFEDVESIFSSGSVSDVLNESNRAEAGTSSSKLHKCSDAEEMKNEKKNKYKAAKSTENGELVRKERLFAINPLTYEVIPVIFDSQADLSFGTGILKVTPCHDPIDFKLGKKHKLAFNKILDEDNRILHSMFRNERRFEARKAVVDELKKRDMFIKEELHDQILPFCSRSGDLIESVVKEQWWCDCKRMAKRALEAVKNNEISMFPEEAKSVWYRWLENIKDWCLSRQLWWGHRIPAYKIFGAEGKEEWIVAEDMESAQAIAEERGCSRVEQDEDVLDTWFSSGLWPFSTLGWPEETPDFARYFPNSLLETGSDILFFWVARMVMLSYELTGMKPFDSVFLHGIVRDAHGVKMSKSVGNVIDPLYVIDGITLEDMMDNIAKGNLDKRELRRAHDALKKDYPNGIQKCGSDALRFTLLSYTNGMKDINLDILRVQGYSRLCNKIWNAYKFVSMNCGEDICKTMNTCGVKDKALKPHQKWMIFRMNNVIVEQHKFISSYNFMAASQSIYQLFFDFCDIFIELSKGAQNDESAVLKYVFIAIIKLFNPFMPFITEEIHSKFYSSIISDYPQVLEGDFSCDFEDILTVAKMARSNKKIVVERFANDSYLSTLSKGNTELTDRLEKYESVGCIKYQVLE